MIQVTDSNEVKCKKGWTLKNIDFTAFSRFQTRCRDIQCIGGKKKFVLTGYNYVPPKYRMGNASLSLIPGTDVMAEHWFNSEEFRNFILDTFVDKSIKGKFYIYTRRGWEKDANGVNSLHNSHKQVIVEWEYRPDDIYFNPDLSSIEQLETYDYPCTAGREDGICECCGTVTCM